uniref:Succinate dehydrogenase subunit 3 n=1 Tax=Dorcoceras hygrometricum TaxID=472368 RepID=G9FCL2_9LAMI|nr:sdh3 gene product [Dorcoceras hygrometricum]AEK53325.1 succinate dehydrogenase subunit 3 [Dorcoceras hygrometricum]
MNILRPLSPHLPIYKPQLTSTFPISHRISGAFLATIVLFFHLLYLKIGFICFTYENVYLFFFYSSKLILIFVEITAFALSYHLYNGVRILHLLVEEVGFFDIKVSRQSKKATSGSNRCFDHDSLLPVRACCHAGKSRGFGKFYLLLDLNQ